MNNSRPKLENLINIREIPTLPEVARIAISKTLSMEKTVDEIASIIKENPSLTLRILKIANSPMYTAGKRISKMRDAIILLGYKTIKSLILSISIRDIFADRDSEWFNYGAFWIHSIATAVIAEEIGKTIRLKPDEDVYSIGLLHDIGKAVLLISEEKGYRKVVESIQEKKCTFREAEQSLFNFDHTDVASFLFQYWEIPEHLIIPVREHHSEPDELAEHPHQPTYIVALANEIAHLGGFGTHPAEPPYEVTALLIERLGLNQSDLERILTGLREHLSAYAEALNIPQTGIRGYFEVLSEANRELGSMYLATQQMTEEIDRKNAFCQTLNSISSIFLRDRKLESAAKAAVHVLINYLRCTALSLELYLTEEKSLLVRAIWPRLLRTDGTLPLERDIEVKEEIVPRGTAAAGKGAKSYPIQMIGTDLGKLVIESDRPVSAPELNSLINQLAMGLHNVQLHFTNRVKSENLSIALKQLREEYHKRQRLAKLNELILESSPVGIVTIERSGSIIHCNREAEDLLGEPLKEKNLFTLNIFAESGLEDAMRSLEKAGKALNITIAPGGKRRNLLIEARQIAETPHTLLLLKDITEQTEQEKILIQKEKMATLGELAAGIAHNLRSPLAVIKGIPELILSDLENKTLKISRTVNGVAGEDTEVVENLKLISKSMEKAFSIIDSIMEFSKLESGKFEEVILERLLGEVFNLISHKLQERNISFKNSTRSCKLYADRNMLTQVFVNLFNNSIAAIEGAGTIEVKCWKEKDNVIVHFMDDGIGVDSQHLELIFEPFFTTTGKANGAGIGLSITRKMVALHGGSIKALQRRGGGTIIEIIFPAKGSGK